MVMGVCILSIFVLTPFFDSAKEGDFGEGKMADSKETKRCTE